MVGVKMSRFDRERKREDAATASFSLEDIDISEELAARPIGAPNRKGETSAMHALAGAMSQSLSLALKRLSNLAIELCHADSAGVSLLESAGAGELFRWRAVSGEIERYIEHYEGETTPRDWSPSGESLKAGRAMLYSYPARHFTYFQKLDLPIAEDLVIPMYSGGSPVGTVWVVSHTSTRRFDAEHARTLTSLGSFAATALRFTPGREAATGEGANTGFRKEPHRERRLAEQSTVEREIVWAEYVRRIALHDEMALEALVRETQPLVFATALRIVSLRVDGEEVAADVYSRVWKTAETFDANRGCVGAWLVSMARSRAIDRFRARAVRRRTEAALLFQCDSREDPDALIDASRTRGRLRRALQALPLEQRRAIELFYFSGVPIADIAAKLSNPVGTVKTRLRLGLMKLRRLLAALETPRPKWDVYPDSAGEETRHDACTMPLFRS